MGFDWMPNRLIYVHGDVVMYGSPPDDQKRVTGSTYEVGPGDIFGDVTFSKELPFYFRMGKYRLPTMKGRFVTSFVSDSWTLINGEVDQEAVELGFNHPWIQLGGGIFDSNSTIIKDKSANSQATNYFGVLTFRTPQQNKFQFMTNLGYISHVGDSVRGTSLNPNSYYDNKIPAGTAELYLSKSGFYFYSGAFARLTEDRNYHDKFTLRSELAYNFDELKKVPFQMGGSFDFKDASFYSKNENTMRVGLLLGGEIAPKMFLNFEALYGLSEREDYGATIQLLVNPPRLKQHENRPVY